MKKFLWAIFIFFLLIIGYSAKTSFLDDDYLSDTEHTNTTLSAGQVIRLDVPEIQNNDGVRRSFEVRVPEEYRKDEPVPLLVWFSPGGGSDRVMSVPPIVDFHTFLVAAIPYPNHRLPRLAIKAKQKKINDFWEYEKPMLDYLQDRFPNISQHIRIAAGFSSGAHLIGSGIDLDWEGFTDFFTAFVLHEGGYAPKMHFSGMRPEHKLLVTYGTAKGYRSYGSVVVRKMRHAGVHPDVIKLPHTTHAMTQESIEAIREWIVETLLLQ